MMCLKRRYLKYLWRGKGKAGSNAGEIRAEEEKEQQKLGLLLAASSSFLSARITTANICSVNPNPGFLCSKKKLQNILITLH